MNITEPGEPGSMTRVRGRTTRRLALCCAVLLSWSGQALAQTSQPETPPTDATEAAPAAPAVEAAQSTASETPEALPAGNETQAAATAELRFVDLSEAISLGRTRSPQVRAAELSSQKAALVVDEADWGWTPKFELKASFTPMPVVERDDTDAEVWSDLSHWGIFTKNELTILVPVFTSFKLTTAEELAEVGLDVERLREEEARLSVTYDVTRAFYGLQLANALAVVSDEADGFMGRVEKGYDKLVAKGSKSVKITDKYRIEAGRADLDLMSSQVGKMQTLADSGLRVHTGLEGRVRVPKMRFKPDDATLKTWDEVAELAQERRPDLRMLAKAQLATRLKLELEHLNWWPDFFVLGTLGLAYSNAVPQAPDDMYAYDPYNSFGFGAVLGARWKLDPMNQYLAVEKADVDVHKLDAQAELARRAALLQVEQVYQDTVGAEQAVVLTKKARRAAKRLMTQQLVDYEVGGDDSDLKDTIGAVKTYIEKRVAFLMALHEYRVKLAQLQMVTGAESVEALLASGSISDYAPTDGSGEDGEDE